MKKIKTLILFSFRTDDKFRRNKLQIFTEKKKKLAIFSIRIMSSYVYIIA